MKSEVDKCRFVKEYPLFSDFLTTDHHQSFLHLDSGLSLTTARDATDVEISDSTEQHKYRRSLIRKRENHDETDSDDVFVEVQYT